MVEHQKLDPNETEVLDKILARVATHAPPPGVDLDGLYQTWPSREGRDYIDALYRPKPIDTLLSDDLIVRRQWFLVSLPHVVTAEDASAIVLRARACGLLDGFEIRQGSDFFGLSRKQPTRLARFAAEWLAPQLNEAEIACTAELLLARAAIQDAKRGFTPWPPAFIQPEQRPAIEVELVFLAQSSKAFGWVFDKKAQMVFRSAALVKALSAAPSKATDKVTSEKLAAAEKKILELKDAIKGLESQAAAAPPASDDTELAGRFKRLYRKHVQNYHPDKLSGRPELDRRVGEEVIRVLNALYQDIKV